MPAAKDKDEIPDDQEATLPANAESALKSYGAKPVGADSLFDWLKEMHPQLLPKFKNSLNKLLRDNLDLPLDTKSPSHGGIIQFAEGFCQIAVKKKSSPVVKNKKVGSKQNYDCTGIALLSALDVSMGNMDGMFMHAVPEDEHIERFLKNIFLGNACQNNVFCDVEDAMLAFHANKPGLLSLDDFEIISKMYLTRGTAEQTAYCGDLKELHTDIIRLSERMPGSSLGAVVIMGGRSYCLGYHKPSGHFVILDSHPTDLTNGGRMFFLADPNELASWILGKGGLSSIHCRVEISVSFFLPRGQESGVHAITKAFTLDTGLIGGPGKFPRPSTDRPGQSPVSTPEGPAEAPEETNEKKAETTKDKPTDEEKKKSEEGDEEKVPSPHPDEPDEPGPKRKPKAPESQED